MSSTNDHGSEETTSSPLSIQDIIGRMTKLHDDLNDASQEQEQEAKADIDSPQLTTATSTTDNIAATNQGVNEQDGNNTGDNNNTAKLNGDATQEKSNNQKGDRLVAAKINTESDKKEQVRHELSKICKELQYMISSFKKLESFETNLSEPLKTLEANVDDILKDLPQVKPEELPKQVPLNLRVLRNNITRVKIQIPLQRQTVNKNSEANRALQTTVASSEAENLPHLYNEGIFENSYYFKEIEEKYKELDDGHRLCLLCFAIFPENAEIKKRLLRFWWVGENLLPAEGLEEEKKLVGKTLDKFVEMGFIEAVQKKNKLQTRGYKMNPIVRSCLIKFAKEVGFFDYDSEGKPTMDFSYCKKACMVKSEGSPVSWFSDYLKEPGTQRERLSSDLIKLQMLFNFPDRETLMYASQRFDYLQTLFNVSKQFPALPIEWFSKMKGIKVLYMGGWESSSGQQRHIEVEDLYFLEGLKNMKKLRLLSLQGISGIPKLPSSLCKLESLRILDLRACHSLEKLPNRIGSLKQLTYLDLSECYLLDDLPKQLNQLRELEVLKGFVIGEDKNACSLDDLSELKKLRKLSVNVNTTAFDIDAEEGALSKFQKLEKLKIAWGSGGLTSNNSTEEDDGEQKSEASKAINGSVKPKPKKQASSATKSSSKKENKEEDKGDEKKVKMGKANSGTSQNIGAPEQDSRKQGSRSIRLGSAVNVGMFTKKLNAIWRERKPKNTQGLANLVKLDLQCFPRSKPPVWLVPGEMIGLRKLCIRGGRLAYLIEKGDEKWKVETLRLKYLMDFKMNWREMQKRFPVLKYLEKVRCPRITFCPCDARGVWQISTK